MQDYSDYSSELAASLERHAVNMEGFTKRYASDMGKELAEAKAGFSHGEFQSWYFSKGIRKTTAWRAMQAAQGKDLKSSTLELLPESSTEPPVEPAEEVQEVRKIRTTNEEKRKTVEDYIAVTPLWHDMRSHTDGCERQPTSSCVILCNYTSFTCVKKNDRVSACI